MAIETAEEGPKMGDLRGDNLYAETARNHWKPSKNTGKVNEDVLKEIWEALSAEDFDIRSLLVLESLQFMEEYLWPGYTGDSSNRHTLFLVLMVNAKIRERLSSFSLLSDKPVQFSSLFRRVLSMAVDHSLSLGLRTHILFFIISAFQSLENPVIRKECAPLVSAAIWHNLDDNDSREQQLEGSLQLRKAWRASLKRYEASDEATKSRLRFERSWLYSIILDFFNQLQATDGSSLLYCQRVVEFLIDLESQLPTRKYVHALLQDLNVLPAIRLSPIFNDEEHGLFRDLYNLLRYYIQFSLDNTTGTPVTQETGDEQYAAALAKLQRVALKHFKEKLTILALSNYGSINNRTDLESHLVGLTDAEIQTLSRHLSLRTTYPNSVKMTVDRSFWLEVLITTFEKRKSFQEIARGLSILPTEKTLFDQSLIRNERYDGSQPLAIPKLNLQYLTIGDFLFRSFVISRAETFFEIRKHIEEVVERLQPQSSPAQSQLRVNGVSKMASLIPKPAILETATSKVGADRPAFVRAEVSLDVSRMNDSVRREWDSLRTDDVVFLLALNGIDETVMQTDGGSTIPTPQNLGIKYLRSAMIYQVLDESGRQLRDVRTGTGTDSYRPRLRRLLLNLDVQSYKADKERAAKGKTDVYEAINVVVRRRARENNFKSILETIQSLISSKIPIPSWLHEVFLGYGDPASAHYTRLPNRLISVDFRDTFLNWEHLIQSFPGKVVEPKSEAHKSFPPPYVLDIEEFPKSFQEPKTSRKRRRDQDSVVQESRTIRVSSYKPANTGPYPADAPKLNKIPFTPAQVEAITSGTQPGMTLIVGPPGTGKTDVVTQIINNIYHNFPEQRTLLVAHSNQALNQLFQKIAALDIDPRHLLRLGHGEEELDTEANYSKSGRVESFLENRAQLLKEVDRLAATFGAPGAHGSTCETASYFDSVYVKPAWTKFNDYIDSDDVSTNNIVDAFPFHAYFSNAPQPLFPLENPTEATLEIAHGCYFHIRKIFSELDNIRPFEILRTPRDQSNYLLVKEARIIAMTSTHAAIRRQQIAGLGGFSYHNFVAEESAQITEIESFIPMALQRNNSQNESQSTLQRVVLCGDHLQNSPIVQNMAFRQYANLEQSLFLRLIRLGVPTITLDRQGRARPSIASLYKWRYNQLDNLPNVETEPEYLAANAGFKYDYQFIDVSDYKGMGETQPTPHFIQNLGEAEYAVAVYQYMRLLGYPASKISILTTYAGQRALIRDVLQHRCGKNKLFGLPKVVTTVDKYQGEQNDYVILSLVRTSRVGYLRDLRRLTVAFSRARLGLYILGRRAVFESTAELQEAFRPFRDRPSSLQLVTNEFHPTSRLLSSTNTTTFTTMEGVEHLGKYVYDITTAKVAALKEQTDSSPVSAQYGGNGG